MSARKALEAVALLGLLVKKSARSRAWFVSAEQTGAVLRNAYESGQPAAAARADEVRDLLLSFGFHAFREIGPRLAEKGSGESSQ